MLMITLPLPIAGFIAFSVLAYASYSISVPVLQHMVEVQADPKQKNLVIGLYNETLSLGGIAGSLTAGFIYSVNAKLPFACAFVIYALAVLAAVCYACYRPKNRQSA
jgi:predicted MFS family arabinose efflux permease